MEDLEHIGMRAGRRPKHEGARKGGQQRTTWGSEIHSPANLAAVRATCRLAATARRSQARRGRRAPRKGARRGKKGKTFVG